MKRGRLPLTALRSFEAAGRLESFSRAADELFVSQAAVSRQVRELEELMGQALFIRSHRRVELTVPGRLLLEQLTASFDDIDRRLTDIMGQPSQGVLRLSVEPAFAAAVLVPRLNQFHRLHPEIDVTIDADTRLVEFRSHEAELAIRHSEKASSWPRTQSKRLFDVLLTPVMVPSLLAEGLPLETPADLSRHTLLHEASRDGWARWFQHAGLPHLAVQRGPIYPDAALVMQAAKLGHGVALGDRRMERVELESGAFVRPFDIEAPYGSYFLVAPSFARLKRPAKAFVEWLSAVTEELSAS